MPGRGWFSQLTHFLKMLNLIILAGKVLMLNHQIKLLSGCNVFRKDGPSCVNTSKTNIRTQILAVKKKKLVHCYYEGFLCLLSKYLCFILCALIEFLSKPALELVMKPGHYYYKRAALCSEHHHHPLFFFSGQVTSVLCLGIVMPGSCVSHTTHSKTHSPAITSLLALSFSTN